MAPRGVSKLIPDYEQEHTIQHALTTIQHELILPPTANPRQDQAKMAHADLVLEGLAHGRGNLTGPWDRHWRS